MTRGETPLLLKLLLPIAVLVWIVARSLFVKFEPPSGIRLHRAHEPELFRMIDEVRGKIRGPRVHDVLVDDNANAREAQVPRLLGMLGSRNYLVLGLPFFFALSADELRAVVAHELGHLSRQVELPPPADLMVVKVPADSPLAKHVAGIPGSLLG